MDAIIDAVEVVADDGSSDGTCFVAVRGGGATGWYGPVAAAIGRQVQGAFSTVAAGRSVRDHHELQAVLRRACVDDARAVASWAVGAIDCATWDLHGRLAGVPVAALLSPAYRRTVPLYASWLSLDIADPAAMDMVARVDREAWRLTKWGLRRTTGSDPKAEAARLAKATRAVVSVTGGAVAFDAVFTWDAALAALVADRLQPSDVLWIEDPLPVHDVDAYRSLATAMPLAIGERLLVCEEGSALLDVAPRAFTIDVVACGGLTRACALVADATACGIPVHPHGRSFVPAVHLAAAYPSAIPAIEYRLQWEPVRQRRYARQWTPACGAVTLPATPGLGADPRSR